MTNLNIQQQVPSTLPWYKQVGKNEWHVLIAGFLGWTLDAFDFIIFTFAISTLIKQWHLTTATTGLIVSFSMIASAVGGILFGVIADYIGRAKTLMLTVLVYALASGLTALSQNVWQLMVFRTLLGLGMGGEWSTGSVLVSESWPKEHRGKALGLMQGGWAMGGILASLVSGPIIANYGWRWLFAVGVIPALLVIYVRLKVKESEIWQENYGKGAKAKVKSSEGRVTILEIFRGQIGKITIFATIFSIVAMFAYYGFGSWIPTYLSTPVAQGGAGLSIVKSSLYVFPYYLGSWIGYTVYGFVSDIIGRRRTFAMFFVGAAVMVPIYVQSVSNTVLFLCLAPLAGFFTLGYFAGFGAMLSEIFPTRMRATAQGFVYNVGRGVSAFAPFFVGSLAMSAGIGKAMMVTSVFFLIAAVVVFILPETKGKQLE